MEKTFGMQNILQKCDYFCCFTVFLINFQKCFPSEGTSCHFRLFCLFVESLDGNGMAMISTSSMCSQKYIEYLQRQHKNYDCS